MTEYQSWINKSWEWNIKENEDLFGSRYIWIFRVCYIMCLFFYLSCMEYLIKIIEFENRK